MYCSDGKNKKEKRPIVNECSVKMWVEMMEHELANCMSSGMTC